MAKKYFLTLLLIFSINIKYTKASDIESSSSSEDYFRGLENSLSQPIIQPHKYSVERENFLFNYESETYDEKAFILKAEELSKHEGFGTKILSYNQSGDIISNISLFSFIIFYKIDSDSELKHEYFDYKQEDDEEEGKEKFVIFESGKETKLKVCKEKYNNKKNLLQISKINNYLYGTMCDLEQDYILSNHFLKIFEKKLLNQEEIHFVEKFIIITREKMTFQDFINLNREGIEISLIKNNIVNIAKKLKKYSEKITKEIENIPFNIFEKIEYSNPEPYKELLENLKADLELASKKVQQNEQDIQVKSSKREKDAIIQRWCSEQKIFHLLMQKGKNESSLVFQNLQERILSSGKLDLKHIRGIFMLLHTYQSPCTCCRFTLPIIKRRFLNEEVKKITPTAPFHIAVTYRRYFSDEDTSDRFRACIDKSSDPFELDEEACCKFTLHQLENKLESGSAQYNQNQAFYTEEGSVNHQELSPVSVSSRVKFFENIS